MSEEAEFAANLKQAREAFREGRRECMSSERGKQVVAFPQGDFDWLLLSLSLLGAELRALKNADPALAYKGVWHPGLYKAGSFVTHGGSIFHADKPTTAKPGEGTDWTLAVKRGRDGKDAR